MAPNDFDPRAERYLPWTEYVYLWVCSLPGGVRVKIGMTNNPDRRMREFLKNCPVVPTLSYVCQAPDRASAYELEQELLKTFRAWSDHGEWVNIPPRKVDAFVAACTDKARSIVSPEVRFREYRTRPVRAWKRKRKNSFG